MPISFLGVIENLVKTKDLPRKIYALHKIRFNLKGVFKSLSLQVKNLGSKFEFQLQSPGAWGSQLPGLGTEGCRFWHESHSSANVRSQRHLVPELLELLLQ